MSEHPVIDSFAGEGPPSGGSYNPPIQPNAMRHPDFAARKVAPAIVDPEAKAYDSCMQALNALDEPARQRVFCALWARVTAKS